MPHVQIKNRFTGAVLFECELGADVETTSDGTKLGAAVKLAFKAGANLADANLAGAYLAGVNLTGAYLARAYLVRANLAGADLADAYLVRADLADAYLVRANLADANLADAYLVGADLAGANLADGGQERRGYRFWAWRHKDGHVVYRAGCREWSSLEEALAHFGPGYTGAGDTAECIARLRLLELCAKARGWIKED